jgi:hypothetical protein
MTIANEILKKLHEKENVISVYEINNNGIKIKKHAIIPELIELHTITG